MKYLENFEFGKKYLVEVKVKIRKILFFYPKIVTN